MLSHYKVDSQFRYKHKLTNQQGRRNLTNSQPTKQKKTTNQPIEMGQFLMTTPITPLAILFLFIIASTAEYCLVECDIRSSYTCIKKDDECTTKKEWNRRKDLIMALLNSFRNEVSLINNDEDLACELFCPIKWAGCKAYCDGIWSSDSCGKKKE